MDVGRIRLLAMSLFRAPPLGRYTANWSPVADGLRLDCLLCRISKTTFFTPPNFVKTIVTSAKEGLFVRLAGLCKKILSRFSQNSVENVAHGLQEKSLHSAGNPDRVTLGLGLPPYSSREDVLPVFV